MAARRRRTVAKRRSPARRRTTARRPARRRYRRNIPQRFSVRNLGKQLQQGVFDAASVVVGKAATRIVANILPLPKGGMILNFATQAVSALGVGALASMFLSRDTARMLIAGGLAAPVESFAKNIPFIGPMLSDDDLTLGDYDPFLPMGEYPAMGDYDPFLPMGEDVYGSDPYGAGIGEYPAVGEYY